MIHVYVADVSNLLDPLENPQIMEGLPERRKLKIMRQKQQLGRKQNLGAGMLLKEVLRVHGIQEGDVCLGKYGKPEMEGIYFNLSHSKNMVVCAVGSSPVGCDIEEMTIAPKGVAERFFRPEEIACIKGDEDFYRLWTMKESYIKMTGEGMHLPMNQFEIRMEEQVKVYRQGQVCSCLIKEYDVLGYKLSVCSEESEFVSQVEYISLAKNGDS